jgi:transposase
VVYRRATILLLSWGGKSVQEMVSILGLHVQTVREWIRTFNAAGPERRWKILTPRRPTGRRPTSGDTIAEGLVDLLHQSPKHYGLTGETWILKDLVHVAQQTGLVPSISQESIRRLLRGEGYVYLQTKWLITSPA